MNRPRQSSGESASWFDPSQVFSDTRKVDLFNDPPWEATTRPSPRPAGDEHRGAPSWWTTAKTAVVDLIKTMVGRGHKVA